MRAASLIAALWSSVALAAGEAPLQCPSGAQPVVNRGPGYVEEWCAAPSSAPPHKSRREGPYRLRSGTSRVEGTHVNDVKHGVWRIWNTEGQLLSEEGYEHGQPRLPWRHLNPDGTPQDESVARADGGRVNRRWHRNGKLALESPTDAAGRQDGTRREWNEAGQLLSESNWKAKAREGLSRAWHPNGQLAEESSWRADRQVGSARTFYENGALREEAKFDDAGREVSWAAYAPDGRKRTAGPCVDDGDCALIKNPVCQPCGSSAWAAIPMVDHHHGRIPKPPADCPPGPFPCMPDPPARAVCTAGKCEAKLGR